MSPTATFRVVQVAGFTLLVFLPWSVPVWILAYVAYKVTGAAREDHSGDGFLAVLGAPALPAYALGLALDRLGRPLGLV